MREFYAIFDQRWSVASRSHANTAPDKSGAYDIGESFLSGDFQGTRKRRRNNRDTTPPEDDNNRKRSGKGSSLVAENQIRLFACPLHQNNPIKHCANVLDGSKFRACAGPGFATISRLKQHLKRVHRAPIQCTRCWHIMPNLQAMSNHANQELRCEAQHPQPEGISADKMDVIMSKWGVTWADIYSILFPGAPVPSPYYEHLGPERDTGKSPSSQSLDDFEAYSRTELPRLVEENLQVMVDAQIAPLEESLKAMLVDIVRRCQSDVAQNYGRISPIARNGIPYAPEPPIQTTTSEGTLDPSASTSHDTDDFQHDCPSFFEEPPLLAANEADAIASLFPSLPHNDAFDSGYGSQPTGESFFALPQQQHTLDGAFDLGYGSQPTGDFCFGLPQQQHTLKNAFDSDYGSQPICDYITGQPQEQHTLDGELFCYSKTKSKEITKHIETGKGSSDQYGLAPESFWNPED
ncbi:MAG: hypothetical protein Q9168_003933 [Polycauliona sp. 1 TL-2023]